MFAIVDIETTGGNPEHDKITDICIVLHDGLSITGKYTSLVNPEKNIPYHITRLTGITNEMVTDAPRFFEIAKQIVEFTEGRIFVAHNVNFDFNFLKAEFKSLGYSFKRDKLCTVKLSRKLLPGFRSYSLGKLCESLSIEIENRHRAEGDADATAILFNLLLAKKNEHQVYRKQNLNDLNTSRLDHVKKELLAKLPEETGVYYFYNEKNEIIYIGKSKNIRQRAFSHFQLMKSGQNKMMYALHDVDFTLTGSELIALLKESEEIKKNQPLFNRARKKHVFTHSIIWEEKNGIMHLKIVPFENNSRVLQSFPNYVSAREKLNTWIDEYHLCLKYCGIFDDEGPCFNYQIKKCYGLCCEMEEEEAYNKRVLQVVEENCFGKKSLLLLDQGRNEEEKSFVWIDKGRYQGYGYINQHADQPTAETLADFLESNQYFPDAEMIIRGFIKGGKVKMINLNNNINRNY